MSFPIDSGANKLGGVSVGIRHVASRRSSRGFWHRSVIALLVGLLCGSSTALSQSHPRLVVYLSTDAKPRVVQTALSEKMGSVEVVVYGRYRDFARELEKRPDAVIALQPVFGVHGLNPELRATRNGQDTEPYVLLSIRATIDRQRFSTLTVGAVDIVGRERTGAFVARMLGLASAPELKYVNKTEDLLPLLQLQGAEAVLLSQRDAALMQSRSKLDLRVTPLEGRAGLAAAAFLTEPGRRIVRPEIQTLNAETNHKLGVDSWR